ncbi:TetR/AcrR family transcriptional regulator [Nocardia sp. NPDC059240]|uniref:TetR/AcrR family transcriptional regulator n=1 Tax=Nocardia sp. NPDC059240 TaxID=3346786 RepID=UPI0036B7882A
MPTPSASYHHGDLPATLLRAAIELLEADGAAGLSLRAVARHAGVSTAAPYRHYADREALLSAVAAVGYRELAAQLLAAHPSPTTPDDLATIAIAYIRFALDRPALFRVMFAEPCNPADPDRVAATEAISAYVKMIVQQSFPTVDPDNLATAVWALVHGLAFLHMDGKLDNSSPELVATQTRAAIHALIAAAATVREPR